MIKPFKGNPQAVLLTAPLIRGNKNKQIRFPVVSL